MVGLKYLHLSLETPLYLHVGSRQIYANARNDQLELRSRSDKRGGRRGAQVIIRQESDELCHHRVLKTWSQCDIYNVLTVLRKQTILLHFSISEWCRSAWCLSDLRGPRSPRAAENVQSSSRSLTGKQQNHCCPKHQHTPNSQDGGTKAETFFTF